MRNTALLICYLLIIGCRQDAYYGYVYDFERKTPIGEVGVNDFLNKRKTLTNSNGYFHLKHENRISGRLIFTKPDYVTDTLETIGMHSGEQSFERFKGDTIYLFDVNSHIRDSISQLNRSHPAAELSTVSLPLDADDLQNAPFKKIGEQIIGLDDYYCSGTYPYYIELPITGKFQVKIIKNECGDFPFYGLITTFRGTLVDKKMISIRDWIDPEEESKVTTVGFKIEEDYSILLKETAVKNSNAKTSTSFWRINSKTGKIEAEE